MDDKKSPKEEGDDKKISNRFSLKTALKSLGPGLITGASDDDPSGIATYSQTGASFGLGMLWMALFQYPMMAVVQEMCARIGITEGDGLAFVMMKKYSKKVVLPIASLLLIANTINIGADIGAMGASIRLLIPQLPFLVPTLLFTGLILFAEIFIPYHKYVKILKYLTMSLFAYVITAMIVGGTFEELFIASVVPHIEFTSEFAMMFVAILGTTISPYLFFWQTSQEAEEDLDKKKIKDIDVGKPDIAKKELKVMRADVAIGMFFSQLIMWAIIVTTAGSLHTHGITDIQTSDQAAKALEPAVKSFPNSGEISKVVFSLGIIGTGLLAVPVLAGSSAYALSDVFGWKQGLNKKFGQAKSFYVVIAASTLIGLWINFSDIDPIKALVYAAVINGVTAVPILYTIMKIANDKKILENRVNRRFSNVLGWATVSIMGISVVVMFATFIFQI
ncbi:MAG TPA: divalent metal cation transporter [Nitrososphaeraceae archaeon]|nr:divalent metal cation transporter [Nitrososphaeraceae archaeon]